MKAIKELLDKFPPPEMLDAIDDNEMRGTRPAPISEGVGYITIAQVRAARAELTDLDNAHCGTCNSNDIVFKERS